MDLQGQNGLLSTFRESWRNRGLVAYAVAFVLMSFYTLLYFRGYNAETDHLGIQDTWAQGASQDWLTRGHGIDAAAIEEAVKQLASW